MLQPLILLANEGTDTGRIIAAHALAKIAITQNPEIAFPGQRVRASELSHLDIMKISRYSVTFVQHFYFMTLSLLSTLLHLLHLTVICNTDHVSNT